jgi:Ca-activated chloride channel family protein
MGAAAGTVIAAMVMSPREQTLPALDGTVSSTDRTELRAQLPTTRILRGAQQPQDLAVAITAPDLLDGSSGRPPLSLAIAIDRSGAMHGRPIENARATALAMLRQLADRDAFAVVTCSSGSEIVLAMQRATEANKAAARAAIETIDDGDGDGGDGGGACLSCGLDAGAAQIARSPVGGGLRRILLISNGRDDRGELAGLAARTAAGGVSISTIGVGLEVDETALRRIAEVGRGNYYLAEDTVGLSAMLGDELAGLARIVASDAALRVSPAPGVVIEDVYGYPMTRAADGGAIVPVGDLRARETRKVVLRLRVAAPQLGEAEIAGVELTWRRVADGAPRSARARAVVDVVTDPAEVGTSVVPEVMQAVQQARNAAEVTAHERAR